MKNLIQHIISLIIVLTASIAIQAKVSFPGKIIAESSNPLTTFIGSPSVVVLPDGTYVVSHDWSGKSVSGVYTSVYSSADKGETWRLLSTIKDIRSANLFYFNGNLYLMGVKSVFGDICIRRSTDSGKTWSDASSLSTGILFKGRYYTAPVPVVIHNGRIWRAYEESPDTITPRNFKAFVISAPVGSDLLNAGNWTKSSGVSFDPDWINGMNPEWCEGNMVVTPEDSLVDFMRVNSEQETNGNFSMDCPVDGFTRYRVAAEIQVAKDGKTISFDPQLNFTNFPGALSKFTIRYDSVSAKYWTVANKVSKTDFTYLGSSNSPVNQRNVLVLYSSSDLVNWEEKYIVLRWNEAKMITRNVNFGFQYADWQIDGNDIVAVVRTSWYGLDSDNSNMMTFHRIPDFRNITIDTSPADLSLLTESVTPLLQWQFTSPTYTGKEVTASSTTTNANLNVSTLSRGAGLTNTSSFVRSFSAATTLADVEDNGKANAILNNQYFQFDVQANDGYSVSLSTIDARLSRNSEGPSSYRWMYSLDGSNFIEISGSDILDFNDATGEGDVQTTVCLDTYSDLQNVPSTKTITLRIYFWGATLSSGRISFGRYSDTTPSLKVGGTVSVTSEIEQPLAAWSLSGITGTSIGSINATTNNEQLQVPVLSRGSGLTPVSLNNAYYSYFSGYASSANGKSNAVANNDYYSFSIQTKSGYAATLSKLSVKLRRNSNGPTAYRWMYSTDNVNFIELGNEDVVFLDNTDNGVVQADIDLSSIAELQNVKSGTTIIFRLYAWGSTSSTGGLAIGRYTGNNCLEVYGTVSEDISILNAWQFYDDGGVISTGREINYASTTTNNAVEVSTLTRGSGNTITSSGHTGGFIGYMSLSQTKQGAIDNNSYFEFQVQPKAGMEISFYAIDAKLRRQEFSAYKYRWMYSLNGTDFSDLGSSDGEITEFAENSGYVQPTLLLNTYPELSSVMAGTTVTVRLYAWGGVETTTTRKHFGFGQSKLATGPSLKISGSVQSTTTTAQSLKTTDNSLKVYVVENGLKLMYNSNEGLTTRVVLQDLLGRTLLNQQVQFNTGQNSLIVPCQLNSGLYILIFSNSKYNGSVKFLK